MAEKACHVFGSTTQVRLNLGVMPQRRNLRRPERGVQNFRTDQRGIRRVTELAATCYKSGEAKRTKRALEHWLPRFCSTPQRILSPAGLRTAKQPARL